MTPDTAATPTPRTPKTSGSAMPYAPTGTWFCPTHLRTLMNGEACGLCEAGLPATEVA